MFTLYKKKEVIFAVIWIVAYSMIMTAIRSNYGDESLPMLIGLAVFWILINLFVSVNRLEDKYGLKKWPRDMKSLLFIIPMWVLMTGNLWDGFKLSYTGKELVFATLSMMIVGFVEEMLFRGFLFKALESKHGIVPAVIISALTFGIGHIVNLFSGQATAETILQIVFAVSWGFMLTMVYYKGGSMLPCILAHAFIDVSSLYGADNATVDMIYVVVTIVVAIAYSIYLAKIKTSENPNASEA